MSKKNSKARKDLERIFGKGCFMERAGIRTIKGVRKDARLMTYHHLKHKSEGGKATTENGANLYLENHQFLHSLPRGEEERINNAIRRWKANFLALKGLSEITDSASVDFPDLTKDEDCVIIELEQNTEEQEKMLKKIKKQQKFSRAQVKRQTQKLIDEELYEEDFEL